MIIMQLAISKKNEIQGREASLKYLEGVQPTRFLQNQIMYELQLKDLHSACVVFYLRPGKPSFP